MIVCICQGVSDRTIQRLVAAGARSLDELASRCGAGADCGLCCALLESMVEASRPRSAREAREVFD
jgi:bacterioferritin-associated ferredoxin